MTDFPLEAFHMDVLSPTRERQPRFSIVLPAYNEEHAIEDSIRMLMKSLSQEDNYELIVVNDGSTDKTGDLLDAWAQVRPHSIRVIHHQVNRGYGAALKTGIRAAKSPLIVITDADGTYPHDKILELVQTIFTRDVAMVVGSRTGEKVEYSKIRRIPKVFLKAYISWIAQIDVPDFNSGLRVFKREIVEKFLNILPNGFSFTTTITLAMITNHYPVVFSPINYHKRIGKSKIHPIRDTIRFAQLIVRTGMYFAPLRVLGPIAAILFLATLGSLGNDIWNMDLTESTLILSMFTINTIMFALLADMIDKRTPK